MSTLRTVQPAWQPICLTCIRVLTVCQRAQQSCGKIRLTNVHWSRPVAAMLTQVR